MVRSNSSPKKTLLYCSLAAALCSLSSEPFAMVPQMAFIEAEFEVSFVGVYVNGSDMGTIDVINMPNTNTAERYLLLEDLVRLTSVDPVKNSSGTKVSTPIGDAQISSSDVLVYNNQPYLSLSTLKALGITAEYKPEDLAVFLNMGWRPKGSSVAVEGETQKPDYFPEKAGIIGLSFDSALTSSQSGYYVGQDGTNQINPTTSQMYADLGLFGYAGGGIWGGSLIGYNHTTNSDYNKSNDVKFLKDVSNGVFVRPDDWDEWAIDNLYWAKASDKFATRIGINRPDSLSHGAQTAGTQFTGAMLAYSSYGIERHLSNFDDDTRSLLENTSQDYQSLSGTAQPGGIAELKVNGYSVARVQIGLDGLYEFKNLDVSTISATDMLIEIAIYAHPLATTPLEVRSIVLGKRKTNVATNELLVELGVGARGNLLKRDDYLGFDESDHSLSSHLYAEYGVSNKLSVRSGVNTNPGTRYVKAEDADLSWHAGVNYSINPNLNLDVSYADTPVQKLAQSQLEYRDNDVLAMYHYQHYNTKPDSSLLALTKDADYSDHQFLLNYSPTNKTHLSLNQYYSDRKLVSGYNRYSAYASVNHRYNDQLSMGASWNTRYDRYTYRANWHSFNRSNTIGLLGDNESDTVSLRHQYNSDLSVGQSLSRLHGDSRLLNQGDVTYSRNASSGLTVEDSASIFSFDKLNQTFGAGYSLFDGDIGYQADWRMSHQNGTSLTLGYKHNYVTTVPADKYEQLELLSPYLMKDSTPGTLKSDYFYAKLSFDMFKPPKKPLRVGRYLRHKGGNIVVDLAHDANDLIGEPVASFSINGTKRDGALVGNSTAGSQYLIEDIKPGDYTLKMDSKGLPLEYASVDEQSIRVRVASHASTYAPIEVYASYGLSGKVVDAKDGQEINIYKNNELVASTNSGSYGYFQVADLKPGTYEIRSSDYQPYTAEIMNDFILGILLIKGDQ